MSSLQYYTSTVSESNDAISICYEIADDELNAILSIIRTNFVSIDHSVATVMFSRDVQDLILTLVEKIKWSVKKITENPLVAAQEEENKVLHKRWSMKFYRFHRSLVIGCNGICIDRVTVKGSIEPMNIYNVDLNVDSLMRKVHKKSQLQTLVRKINRNKLILLNQNNPIIKKQKVLRKMKRDKLNQAVLKIYIVISETWIKDNNIKQSRALFNKEFYHKWEQRFSCYLSGDWDQAN